MAAHRRAVPLIVAAFVLAACGMPSTPSAADLQATLEAQVQATIAAQGAAATTAPYRSHTCPRAR